MQLATLVRNWWMMAVRGAFAIVFGLTLVLWPDVTLATVVVLFGAYAVLDGLWAIGAAAWASARSFDAWPVALEGAVSVVLGGIALLWPFVSREFIYVVAFWGLLTGALEIFEAVGLPRETAGHWLLGTGGVSSVFLALLILMLPRADAASVVPLIAAYAFVFGVLVSLAAIRFRGRARARHGVLSGQGAR
jgi:uncharacterized membrane protein HdeD (DUF308 family)